MSSVIFAVVIFSVYFVLI